MAAVVLAAWCGWALSSATAIGKDRPSSFDPFESTSIRQIFQPEAPSTRQAAQPDKRDEPREPADLPAGESEVRIVNDPFESTTASEPAAIVLHAERSNDYDLFDAPASTMTRAVTTSNHDVVAATNDASTPTNEISACIFQENGPALGELIPTPPSAAAIPPTALSTATAWAPTPLAGLGTNIRLPSGLLPRNYSAERPPQEIDYWDPSGATRGWPIVGYQWKATAFCHQPLYFEEINLERYGYGCCGCLQYGVSAAHFFGTVPALPYLMAADCPYECDYTLGHYRPGSCPPWQFHWPPCADPLGTGSELGVITGLIFLIP